MKTTYSYFAKKMFENPAPTVKPCKKLCDVNYIRVNRIKSGISVL